MKTLLAILLSASALSVSAAEPAEGTLTLDQLVIEYSSGPIAGANVAHQSDSGANGPTCAPPLLACDEFALTLDFPEAIEEVYPSAVVRMSWGWEDLSGLGLSDFDCWVLDSEGEVAELSGVGSNNPEAASFLLYGGVYEYTLTCVPFSTTGESYTGRVEVLLGDPVEPEMPEDEESETAGFVGLLVPSSEDDADAQSRSAASQSGGGALGGWLILAGLLAWRRRA